MNPELITKWKQQKVTTNDFVILFKRWEEQEFEVVVEAKTAKEAEAKVWQEGVDAAKEGTNAVQTYDFVGDECAEVYGNRTQTLEEATRNDETFGVDEKKASMEAIKPLLEYLQHSMSPVYLSLEFDGGDHQTLIENFLKHH
jgi:hypothetical protein